MFEPTVHYFLQCRLIKSTLSAIYIINSCSLYSSREPDLVIREIRLRSFMFLSCSHQSEEGDLRMGTSVHTLQIWVTFLLRLCSWYVCKFTLSPFSCVFASCVFPSSEWEWFPFPCMHILSPNPAYKDPSSTRC